MKNTFYIPKSVDDFEAVVNKLYNDLNQLAQDKVNEKDAKVYVEKLCTQFKPLKDEPTWMFLQLDDPDRMPGDARVDFIYRPTYCAAGIMMLAIKKFESVRNIPDIFEILGKVLNGCTGVEFFGNGYEAIEGFLEAMEIFAKAKASSFIQEYPNLSELFTKTYLEALSFLEEKICTGKVVDQWTRQNYVEEGKRILGMHG